MSRGNSIRHVSAAKAKVRAVKLMRKMFGADVGDD